MHLGSGRFAASRYKGYKIYPGPRIEVYFDEPRDVVLIEGDENVELARAEIAEVLDPVDKPGMWRDF